MKWSLRALSLLIVLISNSHGFTNLGSYDHSSSKAIFYAKIDDSNQGIYSIDFETGEYQLLHKGEIDNGIGIGVGASVIFWQDGKINVIDSSNGELLFSKISAAGKDGTYVFSKNRNKVAIYDFENSELVEMNLQSFESVSVQIPSFNSYSYFPRYVAWSNSDESFYYQFDTNDFVANSTRNFRVYRINEGNLELVSTERIDKLTTDLYLKVVASPEARTMVEVVKNDEIIDEYVSRYFSPAYGVPRIIVNDIVRLLGGYGASITNQGSLVKETIQMYRATSSYSQVKKKYRHRDVAFDTSGYVLQYDRRSSTFKVERVDTGEYILTYESPW